MFQRFKDARGALFRIVVSCWSGAGNIQQFPGEEARRRKYTVVFSSMIGQSVF